jgi:hypothetical protein
MEDAQQKLCDSDLTQHLAQNAVEESRHDQSEAVRAQWLEIYRSKRTHEPSDGPKPYAVFAGTICQRQAQLIEKDCTSKKQ